MAILRVAIFLEGASDYQVIPILVERVIKSLIGSHGILFLKGRTRRKGHGFYKEFREILPTLLDENVDIVVAVRDSDKEFPSKRLREMKDELEKVISKVPEVESICFAFGVAHNKLEAWLIADELALARVLGCPHVRKFPEPRKVSDPEVELNHFTRAATEGLETSYVAYADEIAETAEIKVLQKRCPDFNNFKQDVRKCAKQWLAGEGSLSK